ncbi:hypothetical protein [Spirosoma litoris]
MHLPKTGHNGEFRRIDQFAFTASLVWFDSLNAVASQNNTYVLPDLSPSTILPSPSKAIYSFFILYWFSLEA